MVRSDQLLVSLVGTGHPPGFESIHVCCTVIVSSHVTCTVIVA